MNTTGVSWKRFFPTATSGVHLFPEFETRAKAVSGEVFRVPDAAAARETLLRLVDEVGAKKAVVVESPIQEAAGITEALRLRGVTVYTEPTDIAAHAETADIGISGVEFGVAETGSVFQDGTSIATRLVTILPPLHVVFLPSANIVPGITEAFDIISPSFDRGYIGFITGPSRTADIERVLTIGVHGPGRFAIIAVDETPIGGAA
ncbi:MAG: lactate utilization protein C [Syntrophobacterales bacterium CG_4_8_14_3_um_filter_58_8]|nr:MAG: lactate utilization protein C [Syntrophaceae bacterium CG2_30_58_14]PIV04164.1 MAG: lactate utilization protein C [Syntrophobacterales bacterium CG03_land_8_20_14_0_80_58_14]PJC74584.1 MAG: lactate utilization protein C [Syntrophobacterales bacterium CG_4_8_14_3_um_filter_58_8]